MTKEERAKALQELKEHLKKRPTISDKDFMKETEVSKDRYNVGMVLPGRK